MGLLDFIKSKLGMTPKPTDKTPTIADRTGWTGQDFEFLIVGDINVFSDFDNIMTPNTIEWTKTIKNDWHYYQVGQDEFSYSVEEPGIQMTFNKEIPFAKAKIIVDEIIENIKSSGQKADLLILDKKNAYRFD